MMGGCLPRWVPGAQTVCSHAIEALPLNTIVLSAVHQHSSEKEVAPHSSTLAWKIPGTEEPAGLQSVGSL